jgi:hypothetical protein
VTLFGKRKPASMDEAAAAAITELVQQVQTQVDAVLQQSGEVATTTATTTTTAPTTSTYSATTPAPPTTTRATTTCPGGDDLSGDGDCDEDGHHAHRSTMTP